MDVMRYALKKKNGWRVVLFLKSLYLCKSNENNSKSGKSHACQHCNLYKRKLFSTDKKEVVVVVVVVVGDPQGSIRWNPAASRKFTTVTEEVHWSLSAAVLSLCLVYGAVEK